MKAQNHRTQRRPLAGWGLFALVGVLLCFGALNIAVRATWHKLEDGVLWELRPEGVTAADVAARGGAMAAGIQPGDVLVAIDGAPVETRRSRPARARAARASPIPLSYTVLRLGEQQMLTVEVAPAAGRQPDPLFHRRGDRHVHAARRRVRPAPPPERSGDAAFLLAVPGVFRHADVFVQPARSPRLVFLLGRRRRHAAARAAVPAFHAGLSRSARRLDTRRRESASRAAVCRSRPCCSSRT